MEDTGAKLKQLSHDFYIKEHPNTCLDFEDFKLRNPMNDIGTIIQSTDLLENLYLYDGKEIYLHMSQPDKFIAWPEQCEGGFYNILVREWNP